MPSDFKACVAAPNLCYNVNKRDALRETIWMFPLKAFDDGYDIGIFV
jgi:hypothetical protein